ncbi:MAG: phosphoribosylglycinamide formyltransferase [Bradymonadaceae bacterium]
MHTPSALISPDHAPEHPGAPLSLGVLASGRGTNFEAIVEAIERGALNAEIRGVVYNRENAPVAERARRLGIEATFIDHREFEIREAFDARVVEVLEKSQVEWVIMAGWMRLVTDTLLGAFPGRILNIHPSLLPSFPGLRAVEQALRQGVKISGCTVHIVTAEMDAGPILAQAAVPVFDDDTAASLHARIQIEEHRLYPVGIALAAAKALPDDH